MIVTLSVFFGFVALAALYIYSIYRSTRNLKSKVSVWAPEMGTRLLGIDRQLFLFARTRDAREALKAKLGGDVSDSDLDLFVAAYNRHSLHILAGGILMILVLAGVTLLAHKSGLLD